MNRQTGLPGTGTNGGSHRGPSPIAQAVTRSQNGLARDAHGPRWSVAAPARSDLGAAA